ncbi:MAG: hypothetical protein Q6362_009075 [Candidatus Wukongarchaeota archaeon]|nr:hypothetical protein [Candidatus Wukongarchaeota archaeon]
MHNLVEEETFEIKNGFRMIRYLLLKTLDMEIHLFPSVITTSKKIEDFNDYKKTLDKTTSLIINLLRTLIEVFSMRKRMFNLFTDFLNTCDRIEKQAQDVEEAKLGALLISHDYEKLIDLIEKNRRIVKEKISPYDKVIGSIKKEFEIFQKQIEDYASFSNFDEDTVSDDILEALFLLKDIDIDGFWQKIRELEAKIIEKEKEE